MMILTKTRCAAACGALLLALGLQACEHKVIETTRTHEGPNGASVEKKTITEHDDGTVTQEKEIRTTNNP